MSDITLTGEDSIKAIRGRLLKMIVGVPKDVKATNARWAGRLREMLVAHSSGRPGPEQVTGEYNRNYTVVVVDDGMAVNADNPSPQTNRLEFGYVASDSLGRTFHQPPYPHWRPTFEEAYPLYFEDVSQAFPRVWK